MSRSHQIFHLIGGLIYIGIGFTLIIVSKLKTPQYDFFDFEYFNFYFLMYFVLGIASLGIFIISLQSKEIESTLTEEGIHLKNAKMNSHYTFHEIKGISKFFGVITFSFNNGNKLNLSKFRFNNFSEIQKLLDGETSIKRLPFYHAIISRETFCFLPLILIAGYFILFLLTGNKGVLQSYLPLKPIKVVSVEGTISNVSGFLSDNSHIELEEYGHFHSETYAKITLEEYPCIMFNLPYKSDLNNKTINFSGKKTLRENQKAHLKIRERDIEEFNEGISNHLKYTHIKFYYLEVDGHALIEKDNLKY